MPRTRRLSVEALEDRSVPATLDLTGTVLTFTLDAGAAASMTGTAGALTFDAGAAHTVTANAGAQGLGFTTGAQTSGPGDLTTGAVTQLNVVGAAGVETFTIGALSGPFPNFSVVASVETTQLNTVGFDTGTANQTYLGPVTLTGDSTLLGGAIAFGGTVDGAFALTTVAAADTTFGGAVGGVTPLTSLLVNTDTLTAAAIATTTMVSVNNTGAGAITGVVGGTNFVKTGAGTLTLSGANTYTGLTTINAGTLVVTSPTALGADTAGTTVNSGATLDVRAAIGLEPLSIAGTGVGGNGALVTPIDGGGTVGGPVTVTADASIASGFASFLAINGVVGGNFALSFTGQGATVLTAANTYTGPTTLTNGILVVNGSLTSAVTVTGGGFGGTGTVGALTATGGEVALNFPTVGAGGLATLKAGNTVLAAGTTFEPPIGQSGPTGNLAVTGTVNVTGARLFVIANGVPLAAGQSFTIIDNDGSDPVVGTFAGLPQGATVTAGGRNYTISYTGGTGNDVVLTAPPAPAGSTLAISGPTNGTAGLFLPDAAGKYATTPTATLNPFGGLGVNVRTAVADVNGDGVEDTILVTGPGTPIRFAVISGADNTTQIIAPMAPFAGSEDFTSGGFVAAADFEGDGRFEVIVTPDQGGGPRVTIFGLTGGVAGISPPNVPTVLANFFGINDPSFRGGARAATGDVNRDGAPDLIVAAGFLGGPRVSVISGRSVFASTQAPLLGDFFAFPGADATTLRNGVFVASGDVDLDGYADLIFGGGPGGAPRVFILSGSLLITNAQTVAAAQANPIGNFFVAGNTTDRGGVRVATKNADGDARADVIVGSGEGAMSLVRVYFGVSFIDASTPVTSQGFDPFGTILPGGVFVG